jgi:hypothetical protein
VTARVEHTADSRVTSSDGRHKPPFAPAKRGQPHAKLFAGLGEAAVRGQLCR